jgi:hypothetical protein
MQQMPDQNQLNTLVNLIKGDEVKYIIGIEKDGVRHFIKSDSAAPIIGFFYRKALKEEKKPELQNRLLPFPDFWECLPNR